MSVYDDIASLRTCLHQYDRAMGELLWTMANVNASTTLDRVEEDVKRLRVALGVISELEDVNCDEAPLLAKRALGEA